MDDQLVTAIASKAALVSTMAEDCEAAYAEEAAANAALLAAVVEAVRPGLKALSRKVVGSYVLSYRDSSGLMPEEDTIDLDRRGVLVAGTGKPRRDIPRADSGQYEGTGLYLGTDGHFFLIEYQGRWSKWQGAGESWNALLTKLPLATVEDEWNVSEIIEGLSAALDRQLEGKGPERATAARERAAKVRAIVELLG